MIRTHKLNVRLSWEVFKNCGGIRKIVPKECYINMFKVVTDYNEMFQLDEWKVAYGYVDLTMAKGLMARHCFAVNKQGEVIDPTMIALNHLDENNMPQYMSFEILEFEEYMQLIKENDWIPDLVKPLRNKERMIAQPWAEKNKRILIG